MKRISKFIIALGAVGLGVIIGIVIMGSFDNDFINEKDARSFVEERYKGEITDVSLSEDEDNFVISLEDEEKIYEIVLNRKDSVIDNMNVTENPDYAAAENTEEKTEDNSSEENKDEQKEAEDKQNTEEAEQENTKTDVPSGISEDEAKEIALNEVGGRFLQLSLNDSVSPREYLVMNLVDDDDEAAIVSINADTGEINRVIWMDIELNEISDLDAFIKESADYNSESPYYNTEFDYEDGEYEEYDN